MSTEQPAPTPNDRPAVWHMVIGDMQVRDTVGRERYGVPLQPFNGRDALRDLYEELLDAVVYTRQELIERAERDAVYEAMRAALKPFADEVNAYVMDSDAPVAYRRAKAALARAAELEGSGS